MRLKMQLCHMIIIMHSCSMRMHMQHATQCSNAAEINSMYGRARGQQAHCNQEVKFKKGSSIKNNCLNLKREVGRISI